MSEQSWPLPDKRRLDWTMNEWAWAIAQSGSYHEENKDAFGLSIRARIYVSFKPDELARAGGAPVDSIIQAKGLGKAMWWRVTHVTDPDPGCLTEVTLTQMKPPRRPRPDGILTVLKHDDTEKVDRRREKRARRLRAARVGLGRIEDLL